jgi:hypothetical protein
MEKKDRATLEGEDGTGRPEKTNKRKSKKTKRSIDYVAMKSPEQTGRVTHENFVSKFYLFEIFFRLGNIVQIGRRRSRW